jgi:cob(I)alamin adenosyltransferase
MWCGRLGDGVFGAVEKDITMQGSRRRGYVQVYTGEGKGKTTAAIGLALRAAGAGWPVFIGQFLKGTSGSEMAALDRFSDCITTRQFGSGRLVGRQAGAIDRDCAERGLSECREAVLSEDYRLVVLDEINMAQALRLLSLASVEALIDDKPDPLELVLTGRWAHSRILERADLVTEMREVKHYFQHGVLARTGIEK